MNPNLETEQYWLSITPRDARIYLLKDGAVITAEDKSMLQALYSRDPGSIESHLEKVKKSGSGKFMEQFYVGYGHKSIGDCGSVTLFIEGVSMLAAKALQEGQLYSGQEVSTRYVNFERQPFLSAFKTSTVKETAVLDTLRKFYVENLPLVEEHLLLQFPRKETESFPMYIKAIKARAFDIMRGFLPAGASTSLSWTSNLRQLADRLAYLRHHPLVEVREIAHALQEVLEKGAPHSFGQKKYPDQEEFNGQWMKHNAYQKPLQGCPVFDFKVERVDTELYSQFAHFFKTRPLKTELPPHFAALGSFRCHMLLDFGSYRDIQRHRSIVQLPPLLTTDYGFESWYLEQLPQKVRDDASQLLQQLEPIILNHSTLREDSQYLIPMGYRVPLSMVGSVSAWIYVAETRCATTVHPTLRVKAHMMAEKIRETLGPDSVRLPTFDEALSRFDVRRGGQDIVEKKN